MKSATPPSSNLSAAQIEDLLVPYLQQTDFTRPVLYDQLSEYLRLLLKWNARTNLTAIRDPEEIVRRHFGESLFAAQYLGDCHSLLDFGSGAGFPGLPIQLVYPDLQVTLAESQNKKATFLREVVRTLGLNSTIWADRVEAMPVDQRFDTVALRAVDNMQQAVTEASLRASRRLLILTTRGQNLPTLASFETANTVALPGANEQQLLVLIRQASLP